MNKMNIQKISNAVNKNVDFTGVIQIVEKGIKKLEIAKGYAKKEDEIPNNMNTSFGIASGTKGFTALAVLKLIDESKLSLEDDVFKMLPYDFPNMKEKVTVRQLLCHTSGIYDYFDEDVVEDFAQLFEIVPIHKIHGPKDMLPLLTQGNNYFKPGKKFKYCNSGFVILGMLVETVSKMSYSQYLTEHIIKPLNLTGTGCFKTNQLPKNTASGYVRNADGKWCTNIFEIPMACTADGGLYTTVDDISKIWTELIKGNFLSKKTKAETLKIQATINKNAYYGLGFYIIYDDEGTLKNYALVGGDPGVSFHSRYYIKEDRILTIIGNTSDSADDMLDKIRQYLD